MGPAGRRRVPGSGGLVTAQARTATDRVEPDRVPRAAVPAEYNDWVAACIGKGALTVVGQAGKGGAAVGRDRCAGNVDGVGVAASRVVVSDNDLVEVIRVRRGMSPTE